MSELTFEVTPFRASRPSTSRRPVVCLARDDWDDFGHRTLFYATYFEDDEPKPLGMVKILRRGTSVTADVLPRRFDELDEDFVSLWQTSEAYEQIVALAEDGKRLLAALRDAAVDPERGGAFESEDGWRVSLLRSSAAIVALERGRVLFGLQTMTTTMMRFAYSMKGPDGLERRVDFEFDRAHPWGRLFVLAGANGTGKTSLLSDLALSICGWNLERVEAPEPGSFSPKRPPLTVLAVSYSPFDRFPRPRRTTGRTKSYDYFGLRDDDAGGGGHHIDVDARLFELGRILRRMPKDRLAQTHALLTRLGVLPEGDPEDHLRKKRFRSFAAEMRGWSAGHQIVTNVLVRLIASTRRSSLVLFDEPELHLHPTLLSSLLRCLHDLLDERDAFCIVATHSPIPVQEVPSRFVRVLQRVGKRVRATRPADQTFGAALDEIVGSIFRLGPEDQNYLTTLLEKLGEKGAARRIRHAFGNQLSLSLRVALDAEDPRS